MRKTKIVYFLLLLITVTTALPLPLLAQSSFNPNYVLADQDIFDYDSLTLEQIQKFLVDKKSTLVNYVDPITSMVAADVIYRAAQEYKVNPKYLLTLLQKEQGLIENGAPSQKKYDWATGYGICDDCSMDDPQLLKFKGFFNQVIWAAKFVRRKHDEEIKVNGKTATGFGPGVTKRVDGMPITPSNSATAILYTYTPHLDGNELLWTVWNRYFSINYPDGTLLNVEGKKEVWLIENGLRKKFANRSVYLSRYSNFDRVISVSESELKKYPEGAVIKFPAYAYLKSPKGTVYLLLPNNTIRGFASKEALRKLGVNPEEIEKVEQADLLEYAEGQPITTKSLYPLGTLIQNNKTGGVYFVQDGVKHPIASKEILNTHFAKRKISLKMKPEELEKFSTGEPLLFKEGDLVQPKDSTTVYIISNKKKRPIASASAFDKLGLSWKNVMTTSEDALALHELGEPVGDPF